MKTQEAREKILAIITEKGTVSPQQINEAGKGKIPLVQIYGITKSLVEEGLIEMEEKEKNKFYSLADQSKVKQPLPGNDKKPAKQSGAISEEDGLEENDDKKSDKSFGRNMTKYKFNGNEYNKGRLAHAIITQYAKEKKPTLKQAVELFPDAIVPPYGLIKPTAEAKKMSEKYQRFFIKPDEEIKLKDGSVCVSNQMTPERIDKIIAIARKELGYKIK